MWVVWKYGGLASFTQNNSFQIHPVVVYISSSFFITFHDNSIPRFVYTLMDIRVVDGPVDGHRVVSSFWLQQMMLVSKIVYKSLCKC